MLIRTGRVDHYYGKIKVAVIKLESPVKIGDKLLFVRGGEELFEQEIVSLQSEHQPINSGDTGDVVGLKTINPVKEDAEVYKIG